MKIAHCSSCGNPIEKKSDTHYYCSVCNDSFWNNEKAAVTLIILKNNKILVAKRGIEPNKGKFDLPGGFVDYLEHPYATARREAEEEAGIVVKKISFFDIYINEYIPYVSTCDLMLLVEEWEGEIHARDDVEKFSWEDFEFMDTPEFCAPYTGLSQKLHDYVNNGTIPEIKVQ